MSLMNASKVRETYMRDSDERVFRKAENEWTVSKLRFPTLFKVRH